MTTFLCIVICNYARRRFDVYDIFNSIIIIIVIIILYLLAQSRIIVIIIIV